MIEWNTTGEKKFRGPTGETIKSGPIIRISEAMLNKYNFIRDSGRAINPPMANEDRIENRGG